MHMTRKLLTATVALALFATGCGSGETTNASGGAVREVLMDYEHDEFASAFLRYYPKNVKVHPGDTVRFSATWTGEPHSVTMGGVVDKMFEFLSIFEQYDSEEEARAGGVTQEKINEINAAFSKIPGMTAESEELYQPGAQPCYIADLADVPDYSVDDKPITDASVNCPAANKRQPAFTGKQALYNSGFIPFQGPTANVFDIPIADDAVPGTYQYFCNYHWIGMSGTVEIVPETSDIPSQSAVTRQARKEIEVAAKQPLAKVRAAVKTPPKTPVAGLATGLDDYAVLVNEFYPGNLKAKVGQPVTWKMEGAPHTVSFNVPKYFPVFTVAKSGKVVRDPNSYEAVGWTVPAAPEHAEDGPPPEPRKIDVGKWNGRGGFHSSGLLEPDETFTMTFTKPGTYPFACVIHPPMIGRVTVTA